MNERPQTYGEKAVGLTFNPSGMGDVDKLKKLYAEPMHLRKFELGRSLRSSQIRVRYVHYQFPAK
jgi:hypothetical protein